VSCSKRNSVGTAAVLDQLRSDRLWQRAPEEVRQRALGRLESALRARPRRRAARARLALAALLLLAVGLGWAVDREAQRQDAVAVVLQPEPARFGTAESAASARRASDTSDPGVPDFEVTTIAVARGADPAWLAAPNLVLNGDFSQGDRLWSVQRLPDAHVRRSVSSGAPPLAGAAFRLRNGWLCASLSSRQRSLGVWGGESGAEPPGFALAAHRRYRLSLRVEASGALPVELLLQVTPLGSTRPLVVAALPRGSAPQYFTADFEPAAASSARVVFLARAGAGAGSSEICLDEIAVTGG
jgi:hypothetical protein